MAYRIKTMPVTYLYALKNMKKEEKGTEKEIYGKAFFEAGL
jgi:hypothetical protein